VYPDRARTVVLLGLAFAFLSEVYQLVMPINRSFSLFDALADAVGLAVALGVWWALRRRQAPAPAG
jgi:VanZ family protein